jgi:N-acetylmuramoyl-L-alanine amidase
MILKSYLEGCGANVIMTRTENDVDLSNQERAKMATSSNCDLFLRIHADSANDSKTSGIQMYVPSTGENYQTDMTRGKELGEKLSEIMQIPFNGVLSTEVYTGLNFAKSANSLQISLGYLSNSDDEAVITNEEMQYKIVVCLAQFCEQYKK